MMTISHLVIGAGSACALLQTTSPTLIGISTIASLLPDIDTTKSPAGKAFFPIALLLERYVPHRGATHSFFASAAIAVVGYVLVFLGILRPEHINAAVIGYSSHYLADMFTKSGCQLMWPFTSVPWACPGNHRWRISTGSRVEYGILFFLIGLTFALFSVQSKGGFTMEIGRFLGTTSGVETVYNQYGSNKLITVDIEGVRSDNRNPIKGNFTLIQQAGQGFIVKNNQSELFKVSDEQDAQIIPSKVTASPGRDATTLIQSVAINDEAIAPKLVQVYQAYPNAEIYISGSITLEDFEEFNPVSEPGKLVTIKKYANVAELTAAPLKFAYNQLAQHWGTGNLNVRIILVK